MDTFETNGFSKHQNPPANDNDNDKLMPTSLQDIQWGCPTDELTTLSPTQVRNFLAQGQPLIDCQLDELDLAATEFSGTVVHSSLPHRTH